MFTGAPGPSAIFGGVVVGTTIQLVGSESRLNIANSLGIAGRVVLLRGRVSIPNLMDADRRSST